MNKHAILTWTIAPLLLLGASSSSAVTLLSENFEGVDGPFPSQSCGGSCDHNVDVGVPVTSTSVYPGSVSLGSNDYADGADNDWYAAVFEQDDNGFTATDVGVQETGGGSNQTHVGLAKDDSGLIIKFDASGMENVTLSFDWRTFKVGSSDKFVVGYFVGDLLAGKTNGFNDYREINLSPAGNASPQTGGGEDGSWNWDPVNDGNDGDWIELLRGNASNSWDSETFSLDLADGESEVWLAFWLDNGDHDHGKFDNVLVTGNAVVPVPAAVWLFGSGLLGLVGIARRKAS